MELLINITNEFSTPPVEDNKLSSTCTIEAGNVFDNTGNETAFREAVGQQAWLMAKETGVPSTGETNLRVLISITRI